MLFHVLMKVVVPPGTAAATLERLGREEHERRPNCSGRARGSTFGGSSVSSRTSASFGSIAAKSCTPSSNRCRFIPS